MRLEVVTPQSKMYTSQPTIRTRLFSWGRADLRNICLLLAGFALILLLIPPGRSYPISDDWAYAQSVDRLLHLNYYPHFPYGWVQPTAIGHFIWGVAFSLLFGFSFTSLSLANLFVSACCLVAFYGLLRQLNIAPTPALLGIALLGLNPMYVYLSYSYMTDITLILYMLVSYFCLARWTSGGANQWLLLGSISIALAYLTRQLGIALLPAMFFYLWYARRLSWRNILLLCTIPVLTIATFMLWEYAQPAQLVSSMVSMVTQKALSDPLQFLVAQLTRFAILFSFPGLCMLPLLAYFKPKYLVFPILIFIAFVLFQVRGLILYGTMFPALGNLVDHSGFVLYDYYAAPIWTEQIWILLGVIGTFTMSLYIISTMTSLFQWVRTIPNQQFQIRRINADPTIIMYASGLLLVAINFASPYPFDRYILPLIPVMLLLPLKRMSVFYDPAPEIGLDDPARHSAILERRPKMAFALVLPLALFSILALRDHREHSAVRWQAAEQLAAQGVPYDQISAGFEYSSWYLFGEGIEYIKSTGDKTNANAAYLAVLDPAYVVGDVPLDGYKEIGSFDYKCWLCGGTTRHVLVQARQSP